MKTVKLNHIISHCKKWRQENPDTWIEHYKNQDKLEDAIFYAGIAENRLGKRNGHQRRLKKLNLEKFTVNLIDKKNEIQNSKTFDELLRIVESCKLNGIGPLACYDTANRIGAKLGLKPDVIYLHAGTKKGAEKILKKRLIQKYLHKDELPIIFQIKNLTPAEIEDILCIYKDRF